jgi:hypothetical protein
MVNFLRLPAPSATDQGLRTAAMACARKKLRYPAAKPLPPAAERRHDEGIARDFSPAA